MRKSSILCTFINSKGNTKTEERNMKAIRILYWVSLVLVVIGGLNWGLVGIAKFDLVATIFGAMTVLSRIVYTLVGLAAVCIVISLAASKSEAGPQP